MKIGIDASRAFVKERTGIEEYSYQLIKNLAAMGASCHHIFLYVKKCPKIDFRLPNNFFVKEIKKDKLWTQVGLSLEMKKKPVDLLFIPSYTVPIIHPKKTIVTIHGLEYKHCPGCYSLKERTFLELNTLISIKWSVGIIAPSESTKKDLIRFYNLNPAKINVIYHGAGDTKSDRNETLKAKGGRQGKRENFNILFIGRLEARKNLVCLVKAFERFREVVDKENYGMLPESARKIKLTLAGRTGFGFEEIKKAVENSPYGRDIILKRYVSKEKKEKLYQTADIFVMPSLYEGFGLTVLEAMEHGVPVVCLSTSSMPEITGNAALLVRSGGVKEVADAMKRLYYDDKLKRSMIDKGFANSRKFSWKKCAGETLNFLCQSINATNQK